ncbi:MAG: hypothetical protein QM718_06130 [Steroidobacteraceae bacterium]
MSIQRGFILTFLGMFLLWGGRLAAVIIFIVGLFRLLFAQLQPGLMTLGLAVVVGVATRLLAGGFMLTGAAAMARSAMAAGMGAGPNSSAPRPPPGGSGNVYEGEVVDSDSTRQRKPGNLPSDRR